MLRKGGFKLFCHLAQTAHVGRLVGETTLNPKPDNGSQVPASWQGLYAGLKGTQLSQT